MQNNCDSNKPNSSDSTDKHSSSNDGRPSLRGVLIKRILMSRDKAYIGQSVAISVKTHNNSEKKTYVSINGTLGAQQYLQFSGYPGKRTIIINVYREDGLRESRKTEIEIMQPEDCQTFPFLISAKDHTGESQAKWSIADPESYHRQGTRYLWDFGDGQRAVSEEPTVSHSYEESLNPDSTYSTFHLTLSILRRDETKIKVSRSITVWNIYAVNKRRGIIQPKLIYEFRVRPDGKRLFAPLTIRNLESEPIFITHRQIEFLYTDPEQVTTPLPPQPFSIQVPTKGITETEFGIALSELPPDAFGYAVHLHGRTESGMKVHTSAYFEHHTFHPRSVQIIDRLDLIAVLNEIRNSHTNCRSEPNILRLADVQKYIDGQVLNNRKLFPSVLSEVFNGRKFFDIRSGDAVVGQECLPDEEAPSEDLVCQLTDEWAWVHIPGRIVNANKGDVILSPGGNGPIGGLLQQVNPPQMYSHSGIMIQNFYKIRHSTASEDWLAEQTVGTLLGESGTDGLDPDKLKYIWPGTIDQTSEKAFHGSLLNDPEGKKDKYGVVKQYRLSAFDAQSKMNANGVIIDPVVVMPERLAEAANPLLRDALHKVAEAAKGINGHYRFFCYTDGSASMDLNPQFNAPDRGTGWWASGTRATVCSSLVCASVHSVKNPVLRLEGPLFFTTPADIEPGNVGAQTDFRTIDGFYLYSEEERKSAGEWLWQYFYDLAYAKSGDLGRFLTDAPSDLANQITNTFAFDWSGEDGSGTHAKDSDRWKNPGVGRAVSPDNIHLFWDAPQPHGANLLLGLYGYSEKVIYREPYLEWRRVSRWVRKPKEADLSGLVLYQGNPVAGANVQVAGKSPVTGGDGRFYVKIPGGPYRVEAGKLINGGYMQGAVDINVAAGGNANITISLSEPPDWFREITIRGTMNIKDEENFGDDEYATRSFFRNGIQIGPFGTHAESGWTEKMGGEIRVELYLRLDWKIDSSIDVAWNVRLFEGTSEDTGDLDGERSGMVNISKDTTHDLRIFVSNTDEDDDDHADISLLISNARRP